MKRMIFTWMLTLVSSAWMANEASSWCMPSVRTTAEPWIEVSGTFQAEGFPCEPDEICLPCLTIVLVTSDKTYYLVTDDGQLIEYLDTIQLGTKATVSGIPFERGSYDYIQVSHIETDQTSQLPSLCDEWNILEVSNVTCGDCEVYRTYHSQLTTDTIINGKVYAQLIEDGAYRAALREGNNRDVYCIPAGSTHEYLLYAFNVQEGNQLTNLWIGGTPADYPDGWTMTIEEIQETNPRTFVLSTGFIHTDEGVENYPLYITWIEGVGLTDGPIGVKRCVGCADSRGQGVLCAYKNGEHIYISDLGEQYGCEYNYDPYSTPADTIPLYAQDDPGSSTVDPVDPNQVVVTLQGDALTVKDFSGEVITMELSLTDLKAQMPALNRVANTQTFQNEVTVTLTEEGLYTLVLTNPSWEYTIYGTFNYPQRKDAIDQNVVPKPAAEKILRDGQLLIRKGDKIYTILGIH